MDQLVDVVPIARHSDLHGTGHHGHVAQHTGERMEEGQRNDHVHVLILEAARQVVVDQLSIVDNVRMGQAGTLGFARGARCEQYHCWRIRINGVGDGSRQGSVTVLHKSLQGMVRLSLCLC